MPTPIAFCITTLDAGGAERQLVEIATRLPRDRFESAVVVLSDPPRPPTDELLATLAEHSVPCSFLGGRYVWQAPIVYRRLLDWLRQTRPALLQCFLAHANVLGTWAAARLGIPIVTNIRTAEQRWNGHRWWQRRTSPLAARHVCVSQSVADFAEHVMRLPPDKMVVIPNGVDVARFTKVEPIPLAELGLPPRRRMILFVGRLEADKRPDWLVDRLPALTARLPNHDLVMVGRGPLLAPLRRRAAHLGVADRVHFAGWRSDVPRLLAAAEMVVLTSAWEGMPNVILEAMAAARPIIATEVHGVVELLGKVTGGQLTPSNDATAFIDAVTRIADAPRLAAELGQGNRQRAASEFSFARVVDRYAGLYASILGRSGRPEPPFAR